MEVCVSFVPDDETPEAVDRSEDALDDPSALSEMAATFDAASGDARRDGARPQVAPTAIGVAGPVGMELGGSPSWPPPLVPNLPGGIDDSGRRHAVVAIGSGPDDGERNPARSTMIWRSVPGFRSCRGARDLERQPLPRGRRVANERNTDERVARLGRRPPALWTGLPSRHQRRDPGPRIVRSQLSHHADEIMPAWLANGFVRRS